MFCPSAKGKHDVPFVLLAGGSQAAGFLPMKSPRKQEAAAAANVFQFSLAGLIIFSVALIGASAFVGYKLTARNQSNPANVFAKNPNDKSQSVHTGAWGSLITRDIDLERPVEYLTDEVASPQPEVWTFTAMKPETLKVWLAQHGLSAAQVAELFGPGTVTESGNSTTFQ